MKATWGTAAASLLLCGTTVQATVLWNDLGTTLVHETGSGTDILGGAIRRDDMAGDVLYFKFHVNPGSDVSTEEYFAGFQLFQGEAAHLGVGNSLSAWAYSAFNTDATGEANKVFGDLDLRSGDPEASTSPGVFLPYELPRRGLERTIVFKVEFVPHAHDRITVWMNPDLRPGASEQSQPEKLTTTFTADASFDQIRLRHGGGGEGWTFSDMCIATQFADLAEPEGTEGGGTIRSAGGSAADLTFRSWQRDQGLPQNAVHALAQTRDGYIWLGNEEGIARFDGVRFESFGLREGLRGGRVRALWAGTDGALWIGTAGGGLARWNGRRFFSFGQGDGLPADAVTALAEDKDGHLWVGTEAGLAICLKGRLEPLPEAAAIKGKPVTALYRDASGGMWVAAAGLGVFHEEGGGLRRINGGGVDALLADTHCILVDRGGRLWLGAGDDYVICREREGADWRRYRLPRHLARPLVSALAERADGVVWAGSVSEGLFEFKGGQPSAINAASGLSDNLVESLLVDREGSLWVGTGSGLTRVRTRELQVFAQAEGLGYGAVGGMAEVTPGKIWAGKPGDGIYTFLGGRFERLADPSPAVGVSALLRARDGTCWAACNQGLLHYTNPASAQPRSEPAALAGQPVAALAEDRVGTIWAGTRSGQLWARVGGAWTCRTNIPPAHPITAIAPTPGDDLWLGTEGAGLWRWQTADGGRLEKIEHTPGDLVRALHLDSNDTLWVGTVGGGLGVWRQGLMRTVTTRDGLPDNTISQILEDDRGRLWLGSSRGIACVDKGDLDGLLSGTSRALYPRMFGRSEGMLSEECTGGFCPAGLKTRSGQLWFATTKGIVGLDPHPDRQSEPPPPAVLEAVLVDDTPVTVSTRGPGSPALLETAGADSLARIPGDERVIIGPGRHRIEIRYTGLSFTGPERVRFHYRLDPLDAAWVEAGIRRSAYYDNVPPGDYTFRVSVCNREGLWSQQDARLELTVQTRFFQSVWFRLTLGGAFLLTVAGLAHLAEKRRTKRRFDQLAQAHAIERERSRIAQDLHDDLGSSLTRISLTCGLLKTDRENPAQVDAHVARISQAAGQTVRSLEEIVWALRPGSDSLQSLVDYIAHFADELSEGSAARCRLDLPHDLPSCSLPPEARHDIFLIVKEALTNAYQHAKPREVSIRAAIAGRVLELVVEDDGQGFRPEESTRDSQRQGLGNMRRRAAALQARLEIRSAPGAGTKVRLEVPLPLPG